MLKPFSALVLASLSLLLVATTAFAQSSTLERDFAENVQVLADNSLLDSGDGIYRASGNVRIRQGSLLITAHTLEITGTDANSNEAEIFILEGNNGEPATYEQEIEEGFIVNAQAHRIEYDATERVLRLFGAAELFQNGNLVRAESIVYNVEKKQVSAARGEEGQVETIFRPRPRTEQQNP